MATFYRTGVETYSIIGTAGEMDDIPGGEERISDGSTYFAVDENMFYTFYDGTWYETLPEAARLYHDDVGTDTKPIKLVGGVATVVANELAEDSKVVHKTGNETVAGQKTFTSPLLTKNTQNNNQLNVYSRGIYNSIRSRNYTADDAGFDETFQLGTTYATSALNSFFVRAFAPRAVKGDESEGQTSIALYLMPNNDGTGAVNLSYRKATGSAVDLAVGSFDGSSFSLLAPTYTADNNADTKIVNRSMLAQTPTVVHTTGNEEIAGTKTFSGQVAVGDLAWCRSIVSLNAGVWSKAYEYPRTASSGVVMRVFNNYALTATLDTRLVWSIGAASGGYAMAGKVFTTASLAMKLARRASDNVMEVWLGNTSSTANMQLDIECEHFRTSSPVPSVQAGSAPEVGDVYSEVVDAQVVSP